MAMQAIGNTKGSCYTPNYVSNYGNNDNGSHFRALKANERTMQIYMYMGGPSPYWTTEYLRIEMGMG